MSEEKDINFVRICTDIATLKEFKTTTEGCIEAMQIDIKDIKDNLLRRPSWSVSIIITALTGIVIGLATFIITK